MLVACLVAASLGACGSGSPDTTTPPATTASEEPGLARGAVSEEPPAPARSAADEEPGDPEAPVDTVTQPAEGGKDPADIALTQRLAEEFRGRSFRQFVPSRDGDPRKAVILDFFDGITVWAQYAEGAYAIDEWEVSATEYLVETLDGGSEVTIRLVEPRARQILPDECDDCIDPSGLSVSVRNPFGGGQIAFRLNDPDGRLPSPMPVFDRWTRFGEDQYFE